MSENSSAYYYTENKKRLQKKKLMEGIKIFLKKRKISQTMANNVKIFQKMKNKG